jgi:cardiolipin synthase
MMRQTPSISPAVVSGNPEGAFWSPPNIISVIRVLLVPIIYWSFDQNRAGLALVLIALAILTDAVDGYLARTFGWKSAWGLILDPLADKILIGSLAVFLVMFRDFPVWMAVFIVARDIAIILAGVYLYFRPYRLVVPSNRIGKLTTVVTSGAMILYALDWQPYGQWVLWASLICIAGSGWKYMIGFIRLIRRPSGLDASGNGSGPASEMDAFQRSGMGA